MDNKVQRKIRVHAWGGGTGRPRGGCAKGTTWSLFYMKEDEFSLVSKIRFQRERVESSAVEACSTLMPRWGVFWLCLLLPQTVMAWGGVICTKGSEFYC